MTIEITVTEDDFVPTVDPTIAQLRATLDRLTAHVGILRGAVEAADFGPELRRVADVASDDVLAARTLVARLSRE